jgi:hypothetical protein
MMQGIEGIEQATFNVVSYENLQEIIREVFGQTIQLVAAQNWNNDSQYVVYSFDDDDAYAAADIARFVENGTWPGIAVVLEELIRRNYIPPGDYLITVCW